MKSVGKRQAQDLEISLSTSVTDPSQLEKTRLFWEQDMDNDLARFQYATALAHSSHNDDRREALLHLEYLVNHASFYLRDCLYLLATVRYLLGDFEAARACAEELCRLEPDNYQAKNLHIAIKYKHDQVTEEKVEQEKNVSIAVGVGMGAAVLGLGLAFLLRNRK